MKPTHLLILRLISKLFAFFKDKYDENKRSKEQANRQQDRDLAEERPYDWYVQHFGGLQDISDQRSGTTTKICPLSHYQADDQAD